MRPALFLPALVALPFLATAAEAQKIDCATTEVQIEMTACAEDDWKTADAHLNQAYEVAISAMKGIDMNLDKGDRGAEDALRASQRAWITFRDNTCAAEGWAYHGGSMEEMVIYQCRARVTAQRADELDNMAAGD